jgi:hypothetical protein
MPLQGEAPEMLEDMRVPDDPFLEGELERILEQGELGRHDPASSSLSLA